MRALLVVAVLSLPALAAPSKKKVSFEFVNADVQTVLRTFAEVGKFNLVTSEQVTGKVTMRLRNVSWDEAMRAVLAAKALGVEQTESVLRVAPLTQLAAEAEQRARIDEANFKSAPLKTTLIRVNYANASEMAALVKPNLSARGSVSVDARTNTLIIRDVE